MTKTKDFQCVAKLNNIMGVTQTMPTTMGQYNATLADWSQMPVVITVNEMAKILGIGRRKAYELLNEPGFPRIKLGSSYKVYRDGLRQYMENQFDSKGQN